MAGHSCRHGQAGLRAAREERPRRRDGRPDEGYPYPGHVLVGNGPLRGALTWLIAPRGLEAVVRLPGSSYEQPTRYIAGASVHVVPLRGGVVVAKRRAGPGLGVPVVGTEVDGLAHTLGEGRGVLVPARGPHALAEASTPSLARAGPTPGSSPPAQRPWCTQAPTASCSPAARSGEAIAPRP
jgi:glycosyltransferase involved in cell wall biosynthesis